MLLREPHNRCVSDPNNPYFLAIMSKEESVYTHDEIKAIVTGEKFFPESNINDFIYNPDAVEAKIKEIGGKTPTEADVGMALFLAKEHGSKLAWQEYERNREAKLSTLNEEFELPAGAYMLGDPCYFVAEAKWSEACNNIDSRDSAMFELPSEETCWKTKEKGTVLMLSTIHGDGTYPGSNGFGYGVDAGLLGAVDVVCVNNESVANSMKLGTYFESKHPIKVTYNRKKITFSREDGDPVTITIDA